MPSGVRRVAPRPVVHVPGVARDGGPGHVARVQEVQGKAVPSALVGVAIGAVAMALLSHLGELDALDDLGDAGRVQDLHVSATAHIHLAVPEGRRDIDT